MRIVFLGFIALILLPWSNAECPSSAVSLNVTCQPQEDIGVCIRSHLEFGGNGCISVYLSEGTYYLSEKFEVVNRSVSITSTGLVSIVCNLSSSTSSRSVVFSVKEAEFAELNGVRFSSCSSTVEFVSVRTVKIIGATFESFSGSGAVNVFNCDEVFVEDCVFQHSTSTTPLTEDDFRGSSGGLSISSNHPNPPPMSFTIRNTIFRNLTSLISQDKIRNSQDNDAYFRSFQGRGGGMSVILNNSTEMNLLVTNCTFSGNNATLNGGGLYLFVRYLSAGLNMTIFDNLFTNNTVTLSLNATINNGGGAVGVTLYEGSGQDFTNSIQLSRNVFVGNMASYSGALFIVSATVSAASSVDILVEDSLFTDNHALFSGTAITISAPVRLTLDGNEKTTPGTPRSPILRNIVCMNNWALSGGVIFISSYRVVFEGRNVFSRNNGPALRIISSLITVGGELYFQGNTAVDSEGGAMHISNGEVRLKNGSSMIFEDNEGSFGAAIVSEPIYTLSNYIKSPFNPLCFVSYEDSTLLVEQWDGVEIIFASNRALVGSAVYSEEIGLCSHHGRNLTFTTAGVLTSDPPFVYSDNTNRRHPDPYDPSWQLSTPVVRFEIKCRVESVRNSPSRNCSEVRAYPGERVFLDIAAYSELGHRTYGLFSLQVDDSNQDLISVYPPLYSVYPNTRECPFIFSYKHVTSLSLNSFLIVVEANGYSSSTTLDLLPVQVIQIEITPCPVGHEISKETGQCVCQFSEQLRLCDANRLILKNGYWGMSFKNGLSRELLTFKCPPGYCRCYFNFQPNQTFTTSSGCDAPSSSPTVSDNSSSSTCDALFDVFEPNDQCSCDRTGYLCGSCRNGYAVTALLSRCKECSNAKSIFIVILIILDATAIIILCTISVFVERFHFPSSMYALLFYVQIAPYATDDFPVTYERFYQVVRYLGSFLGLYFPYDVCLSSSTTALGAYATRYIPFLVSLVVMPTVIGVMWCFRKKVKMTYNGVWFVWMLILNDLLATSFSILNCPILPDENGTLHPVWYYDGTVKCFVHGGHAVLGIWAIIVLLLVICAMVMILVVMYPTERMKFRQVVRKITEPVVIGFSEKYPFWFFIDFLSRFLFIAVVIYEKDSESAGIFFLSLIIIVNVYFKPYRAFSDNLLHLILLGVFISLLLLRQTSAITDSLQNSFITDIPTNSAICSEADIDLTWFSVILGIWYCLPVLLFAMPLTVAVVKKFSGRCAFLIRKKRQIQKKRGSLKSSNHVVTTELAVFEPLIVEDQQTSLSEDEEEDVEEQAKDKDQHEGELKEKRVSSSGSIVNATITCSDI